MANVLILNEGGWLNPELEYDLNRDGHTAVVCHELWELFETLAVGTYDVVLLATCSAWRGRVVAAFLEGAGVEVPVRWVSLEPGAKVIEPAGFGLVAWRDALPRGRQRVLV